MRTVLLLIAQLYRVERTARERDLCGEELRLLREHGSRPVLEKLHAYLLEIQDQLLPKSEAGQAVAYTLKNWPALTRYCENPDLSIDNNHTERALRCFAVGRANWTFFGSDRGGKTAALASAKVPARLEQWLFWNVKKAAKAIGGEQWLRLRRYFKPA